MTATPAGDIRHHVVIGMGGWDLPPFDGTFYPVKRPKNFRKLEFYSRFFDLVELNASFYNSSFAPHQIRRWLADVGENPRFQFTVKLYKGFTHDRTATGRDAVAITHMLDLLRSAERFAGLLVQFPYSFLNTEDSRNHVLRVCRLFPGVRTYVEFRHASWNAAPVVKMLNEAGVCLVNVDLPQIKQHMPRTAHAYKGVSYFRMMGRNATSWDRPWILDASGRYLLSDRYNYSYSMAELLELSKEIIGRMVRRDKVLVVFHNDIAARSILNALQLHHILHPDEKISIPVQLMRYMPALSGFCIPGSGLRQAHVEEEKRE